MKIGKDYIGVGVGAFILNENNESFNGCSGLEECETYEERKKKQKLING